MRGRHSLTIVLQRHVLAHVCEAICYVNAIPKPASSHSTPGHHLTFRHLASPNSASRGCDRLHRKDESKCNADMAIASKSLCTRRIHTSSDTLCLEKHSQSQFHQSTAVAGPKGIYDKNIANGTLRSDPRQVVAINLLQDVFRNLLKIYPPVKKPSNLTMVDTVPQTRTWWSSLLRKAYPGDKKSTGAPPRVEGLYMWGGVGVGKTMLMDLFVESAPPQFRLKRIHFHDFMISVHMRLRECSGEQDPLRKVAGRIAADTYVLALDELFVTDIADAVILERLFGRLWDRGVTVIATSNRHPATLYEGGLQRQLFLPFIHKLQSNCTVHDMESTTDYRRLATSAVGLYFVRLVEGHSNDDRLAVAFNHTCEGKTAHRDTLEVAMGRTIEVPYAAGSTCWFKFDELLGAPVGASDFIALVDRFHTVALQGVPLFTGANKSLAYRFVTFIDIAYDHHVKVLVSAEGYPEDLFKKVITIADKQAHVGSLEDDVIVDNNLGFAKNRTISRLIEFQTVEYALSHARRHQPELVSALEEKKQRMANK